MKKFWGTLIVLLAFAPLGVAGANALSVSQVIYITATVPPMRFIVVDSHSNIIEITSNSTENVVPKVLRGSLQSSKQVLLTPAILKDYQQKIRGKDLRNADLHFTAATSQAAHKEVSSWLSGLSHMAFLLPSHL